MASSLTLKRLFELATVSNPEPKNIEELLRLDGIPERAKLWWAAKLWQRCVEHNLSDSAKAELEKIKREVPLGKETYLIYVMMARPVKEEDLKELPLDYKGVAKAIVYSRCWDTEDIEPLLKKYPLEELLKHAEDAEILESLIDICEAEEIARAFGKLPISEVKKIIKRLGNITRSFLVEKLLEASVSCGHNPLTLIFLIARACKYEGKPLYGEEILYALDSAKCTAAKRRKFLRALRKHGNRGTA